LIARLIARLQQTGRGRALFDRAPTHPQKMVGVELTSPCGTLVAHVERDRIRIRAIDACHACDLAEMWQCAQRVRTDSKYTAAERAQYAERLRSLQEARFISTLSLTPYVQRGRLTLVSWSKDSETLAIVWQDTRVMLWQWRNPYLSSATKHIAGGPFPVTSFLWSDYENCKHLLIVYHNYCNNRSCWRTVDYVTGEVSPICQFDVAISDYIFMFEWEGENTYVVYTLNWTHMSRHMFHINITEPFDTEICNRERFTDKTYRQSKFFVMMRNIPQSKWPLVTDLSTYHCAWTNNTRKQSIIIMESPDVDKHLRHKTETETVHRPQNHFYTCVLYDSRDGSMTTLPGVTWPFTDNIRHTSKVEYEPRRQRFLIPHLERVSYNIRDEESIDVSNMLWLPNARIATAIIVSQ